MCYNKLIISWKDNKSKDNITISQNIYLKYKYTISIT